MATTATAAGFHQIFSTRHLAVLNRAADILADQLLQAFQLTLCGHEFSGDLIVEKRVTRRFKLTDLSGTQLDAGVLLMVQCLAAFVNALILELRFIIAEKAFHIRLELLECRILCDRGAKFFGLRNHGGILGNEGMDWFCDSGHDPSIDRHIATCNGDFPEFPTFSWVNFSSPTCDAITFVWPKDRPLRILQLLSAG